MNSALFIVLLTSVVGTAQAPPPKPAVQTSAGASACEDVYDATAQCEGVNKTRMYVPGELLVVKAPVTGADQSIWLGWGFGAAAVVSTAAGVALAGTDIYLRRDLALRSAGNLLSPSAIKAAQSQQRLFDLGATSTLVGAGLVAGTALVLWAFDPQRGRLRYELGRDP